jgi:hypothetical protein
VVCVSYWTEVGSPPNETSASLMEVMLREAGTAALVCRGARDLLVPKLALAEARQLPEYTTGLGSW